MQKPLVEGIQVLELLGGSTNGRVYHAQDESGADVVLKVFHEQSIRWDLLRESTLRLEDGGWPAGVLPVLAVDCSEVQSVRLTPALLDKSVNGSVVPRSLQHHFDEYAGGNAMTVVRGVARALAGMHVRGVVHGNLKPCNVMFGADGGIFLTDWQLGNMAGVRDFQFTDALLYQPPEQLVHSVAMEEAGTGWDVFAFGVLAFRLLTGKFPRCHDTYQKVAPPFGQACGEARLVVDLEKVAANLMREAGVVWPEGSCLVVDPELREVLERCLVFDRRKRPASMVEVLDLLDGKQEVRSGVPLGRDRKAVPLFPLRVGIAMALLSALSFAVATGVFAKRWKQAMDESEQRAGKERHVYETWESEKADLVDAREKAVAERLAVEAEAVRMRADLKSEQDRGLARLVASREIGDQLFAWAMEKGHRTLPPLDGRELRLKRLERYYVDFLERTKEVKDLADEHARARLQLAEISLAAGDDNLAASRFDEAFRELSDVPMDAEMRLRIATNRLMLAILKQSHSARDAKESFENARKAFAEVPRSEMDENRIDQLMAVLDLHEAQLLSAKGEDAKALEQLMRATKSLNRLTDEQPDSAVLRSDLAACYLSSATLWEGIGNFGDAREARVLARDVLSKMLEKSPDDIDVKLELAGCIGAMAEACILSGDITRAESLSREAMGHLEQILLSQPDNTEALVRRAVQLGLRAGILRDRGFAPEAMEDYEQGIRILERMRASSRGQALVPYRLALLLWQKGRMLGMDGKREAEIELLGRARAMLAELEAGKALGGPRREQVQRSTVYILGDLGHALQISGQKDKALEVFRDALVLWETLSQSRPRSEEYSEGLVWCRQRVEEME